jgi:hypothetical protein
METPDWRIFFMKDQAADEAASRECGDAPRGLWGVVV